MTDGKDQRTGENFFLPDILTDGEMRFTPNFF